MALLHVDVADVASRNLDDDKFVYEVSYPSDARIGYAEFKRVDSGSVGCDVLIIATGDASRASIKSMILTSRKVGEIVLSGKQSVHLYETRAKDKKKIVVALSPFSFEDQSVFRWVYELVDEVKPKSVVAVDSRPRSTYLGTSAPVLTFYAATEHKLTHVPELPMPLFLDGCAASALSRAQELGIPAIGIRTYLSPIEATHVDTGAQIASAVADALPHLGVTIDAGTMAPPHANASIPPSGSPKEESVSPFRVNFNKEAKALKLATSVSANLRMYT